jgi:hypothetical protein
MEDDKIVQYIVFPPMLSLTPGKLAAQAAHAANKMRMEIASKASEAPKLYAMLCEWEGNWGAGTTVVLQADHIVSDYIWSQIELLPEWNYSIHAGFWYDPSFPYEAMGRRLTTGADVCYYFFGYKSILSPFLKDLKLHP